jgi:hypothetical protein
MKSLIRQLFGATVVQLKLETKLTRFGNEYCLSNCLNSPGNFTASKLKWLPYEGQKYTDRQQFKSF